MYSRLSFHLTAISLHTSPHGLFLTVQNLLMYLTLYFVVRLVQEVFAVTYIVEFLLGPLFYFHF